MEHGEESLSQEAQKLKDRGWPVPYLGTSLEHPLYLMINWKCTPAASRPLQRSPSALLPRAPSLRQTWDKPPLGASLGTHSSLNNNEGPQNRLLQADINILCLGHHVWPDDSSKSSACCRSLSNLLTGVFFAYCSFQEHSAPPINSNKVELLHSIKGYTPYHSIF